MGAGTKKNRHRPGARPRSPPLSCMGLRRRERRLRIQALMRRRRTVERDRVLSLSGRSDPLAGTRPEATVPTPWKRPVQGRAIVRGETPEPWKRLKASSPSRAELSGPWVEPGGSEPGCAMLLAPPVPARRPAPERSREPTEAERGPRAENPPAPTAKARGLSGSGPPGPRSARLSNPRCIGARTMKRACGNP